MPGMYGIDTRALTKKLRVHGSMKGKIVMDEDVPLIDPNLVNQVCLGVSQGSGIMVEGLGFRLIDPNHFNQEANNGCVCECMYVSCMCHCVWFLCQLQKVELY